MAKRGWGISKIRKKNQKLNSKPTINQTSSIISTKKVVSNLYKPKPDIRQTFDILY